MDNPLEGDIVPVSVPVPIKVPDETVPSVEFEIGYGGELANGDCDREVITPVPDNTVLMVPVGLDPDVKLETGYGEVIALEETVITPVPDWNGADVGTVPVAPGMNEEFEYGYGAVVLETTPVPIVEPADGIDVPGEVLTVVELRLGNVDEL